MLTIVGGILLALVALLFWPVTLALLGLYLAFWLLLALPDYAAIGGMFLLLLALFRGFAFGAEWVQHKGLYAHLPRRVSRSAIIRRLETHHPRSAILFIGALLIAFVLSVIELGG